MEKEHRKGASASKDAHLTHGIASSSEVRKSASQSGVRVQEGARQGRGNRYIGSGGACHASPGGGRGRGHRRGWRYIGRTNALRPRRSGSPRRRASISSGANRRGALSASMVNRSGSANTKRPTSLREEGVQGRGERGEGSDEGRSRSCRSCSK